MPTSIIIGDDNTSPRRKRGIPITGLRPWHPRSFSLPVSPDFRPVLFVAGGSVAASCSRPQRGAEILGRRILAAGPRTRQWHNFTRPLGEETHEVEGGHVRSPHLGEEHVPRGDGGVERGDHRPDLDRLLESDHVVEPFPIDRLSRAVLPGDFACRLMHLGILGGRCDQG